MNKSVQLNTAIELINIVPLNPLISKCQIKVCYVDDKPNRNKSIITKEVAKKIANSLPGSPIVGFYNEETGDFEDHNKFLVIEDNQLKLKSNTRPYGFVDLNAKVWFAEFLDSDGIIREYMVTEGYLWTKQYPECNRVIETGNPQSMELDKEGTMGSWVNNEVYIINDALISSLCILGEGVEPCFEGASVTAFSLGEDFKQQMFSMVKELTDLIKKGGDTMPVKFEVAIGSQLWDTAYEIVSTNYSEYSIVDCLQRENETFFALSKDGQYYSLGFAPNEDSDYTFASELIELTDYSNEDSQYTEEAIAEYASKKTQDKIDQEGKAENQNKKDEEKVCPECGKPVSECKCKKAEEKEAYSLSEIVEYVESQEEKGTYSLSEIAEYVELQQNYSLLVSEKESLEAEIAELRQFKTQVERVKKQEMINSFCMLSDSDKEDVVNNIDTYSLDEIEAKLSVICFRNKVSFNTENAENAAIVVNLDKTHEEDPMTPAWVKAAIETQNSMK